MTRLILKLPQSLPTYKHQGPASLLSLVFSQRRSFVGSLQAVFHRWKHFHEVKRLVLNMVTYHRTSTKIITLYTYLRNRPIKELGGTLHTSYETNRATYTSKIFLL